MKLSLLVAGIFPIAIFSQSMQDTIKSGSTPYSSGSSNVHFFDNKARKFNDWSISVGGGTALIHTADLTSFYDRNINWGWNGYVSLDKQLTDVLGVSLQYQMGETNQKGALPGYPAGSANTKFKQVSVLGDINLTSLLRRVDNKSEYKWALHAYAGIGLQGYKTHLVSGDVSGLNDEGKVVYGYYGTYPALGLFEQKLGLASFFFQGGTGVKYKMSNIIDLEGRVMYVITGDDAFDGTGENLAKGPYSYIKKASSDDYFTVNLGLSFNLGMHNPHLRWADPLQNIYNRTSALLNQDLDVEVCNKGDKDNDGVCDDWDRQLDTPAGARVDGAGVALDMDLDGIIDLYDKCVTVPGSVENNGCPSVPVLVQPITVTTQVQEINKDFEGIEFALNSDVIRPQSFEKLNHAASVINTLDKNSQFLVIGATDTRGSDKYNLKLSQKRADAIVKYLNAQGVPSGMLIAEGRGANDLKYPECKPATKCPEWKNEANRRVYFQQK